MDNPELKLLYRKLNALRLEVHPSIVDDIKKTVDAIAELLPSPAHTDARVWESYVDFLHELTSDPYPEDVFLPIPTNVLEMIHSTLMDEYKMPLDRLTGHIGRRLRQPLSVKAKSLLNSLPVQSPPKEYSREQMRSYLLTFMSSHSMKSEAHLGRLVDGYLDTLS